MASPVKPRRVYRSPRREEQARATRSAVLEAARALFEANGFAATTVEAIAGRAGVSVETVYATFGGKRAVLAALLDASIAGGEVAPPIAAQAWVQELRGEPDPRRRLRILARNGSRILERRSALDEVVRGAAAADPEIAVLWRERKAERYAGQRELLAAVVGDARLRDGMNLDTAASVLYAIGSPETFRLLVADRGWTASEFEAWYAATLERLLFPDE